MADDPDKPRRRPGRPRIDTPNPVDVHVGARMRLRRTLLGLSQEKLGEALSLTFQQVQKYERGANRISASRLFELAQVLDVPVSFFFDDMPEARERYQPLQAQAGSLAEAESTYVPGGGENLSRRETVELVRNYYRISSPGVRKRFFELVRALADADGEPDEPLPKRGRGRPVGG